MQLKMTADEYIAASIRELRADLKSKTIFGRAGRAVVHSNGERRLLAPNGEPFRVIELPEGGNQIETSNSLHANIRPKAIRVQLAMKGN